MSAGSGRGADSSWQPTATRERLVLRAGLLARARAFFAARGVLEVETPALVHCAVTDVHLSAAEVRLSGFESAPLYLHTSPEYAMKRLLAAGSGDIFQVCHVFRGGERGPLHNPEFTMIEWYRLGFGLEAMMRETAELVTTLLGRTLETERLSYAQAFRRECGPACDPLTAPIERLRAETLASGLAERSAHDCSREELLEFLVSARVGPALGRGRLTLLHRYPAAQAALARLDPEDERVALRFEIYHEGVELANGFEELASSAEQRARFLADLDERARRGLPRPRIDERLLAALESGLPPCSGVALGFDRVAMLAASCAHIDEVLSFPIESA